ncbi:PrpR N-terminal domain-containing protein [Gracilibacillus sp. S3-1-1]|uniref:PrpR N-terminal domain-containing protein n=1 Tax=Gracilibacillus pellucidus TaxID=3095368 RepID=A0ACC6M3H0_9BACI|nr:PrpR N-terminal domain-containing protein [Gracilibacillus sp. S3-1-1]MDX8045509.1 PrpR N-terminal domain-containing protein [Gracilibacillus sp. S3-1-1]
MKVVAIAPYYGLKEIIQAVINEIEDIVVEVVIGDLEEGVRLAKEAELNGADIIISRGGTAELIQKEVKIPVVEIEVSAYDLLRIFTLIRDSTEKKAIVGFKNVIESALTISNLLEVEVSAYTIEYEEDVMPKLLQLQKEGYQIIIGDTITVRNAEAIGLNGLLLTSGRESVIKAFEEAVKIKQVYTPITTKELIPKTILDQHDTAIIVMDKKLHIFYKNKFAESLYKDVVRRDMDKWVQEVFENGEFRTLAESEGNLLLVSAYLLYFDKEEYACLELSLHENREGNKQKGIQVISPLHEVPLHSMNWFSAKNNLMKDTITKAKAFSLQNENVWIFGELGAGKERLAYLIHLSSERSSTPLLIIDCELTDSDDWSELLGSERNGDGIISNNTEGTVYLKKIEKLALADQKALLEYVQQVASHPRLIISSREKIKQQVDQGEFLYDLYLTLSTLKLMLPPLRERKEDIERLVKLFINKFNYDYGKEIAGIRVGALEVLQNHVWSRNVDELMQVMKEVILIAEGPFINKKEIENVLVKYQAPFNFDSTIPLKGTLKDIELAIIKRVFEEENKNHSRTANRLGINRSTLWRKLKDE